MIIVDYGDEARPPCSSKGAPPQPSFPGTKGPGLSVVQSPPSGLVSFSVLTFCAAVWSMPEASLAWGCPEIPAATPARRWHDLCSPFKMSISLPFPKVSWSLWQHPQWSILLLSRTHCLLFKPASIWDLFYKTPLLWAVTALAFSWCKFPHHGCKRVPWLHLSLSWRLRTQTGSRHHLGLLKPTLFPGPPDVRIGKLIWCKLS